MKWGFVGEEASSEAVAVLQLRVGDLMGVGPGKWMGAFRLQSAWEVKATGHGPSRRG